MSRSSRHNTDIREIEHIWIPMPDGTRLSARVWLPQDAEANPRPAILEYIPYRKRDFTRLRDEPMHRYFAEYGYVALRIDLRGSGESEGVLLDEYLQQELQDGADAIAWIAEQPWCDGNVGMMGKSWGGFNSLQVAALAPPALKAVVAVCATDDRYNDDVHFMGGCLLSDNAEWCSIFHAFLPRPPDPSLVGEAWERMWQQRLDALVCPSETWLQHQTRDDFWKHGSVCENYGAIRCPVFSVGGWTDSYSNPVFRLLANLKVPSRGLVGPWGHTYAHDGAPGPAIGFLQELLRWWDHWLLAEDTGYMDEPQLTVWMQESEPPKTHYATRKGRWVAEEVWPSPRTDIRMLRLGHGTLGPVPVQGIEIVCPDLSVGQGAGDWGAFALPHEHCEDQRSDDAHSTVFDTAPLTEPMEILGAPVLLLRVSVDRANAMLAVRLNDVRPDGSVLRVTYGLLNLTHRNGHAVAEPLVPGTAYDVSIPLNDVAYAFPAGHRIRVAVSTSYWPIAWPSPEPVTASIRLAGSRLTLPRRPMRADDARLRPFDPPEAAAGPKTTQIGAPDAFLRRTFRDPLRNALTRVVNGTGATGGGLLRFDETGLEMGYEAKRRYDICLDDPNSATVSFDHAISLARDGWKVEIDSRSDLRSSPEAFEIDAEIHIRRDGQTVLKKRWNPRIPRNGV